MLQSSVWQFADLLAVCDQRRLLVSLLLHLQVHPRPLDGSPSDFVSCFNEAGFYSGNRFATTSHLDSSRRQLLRDCWLLHPYMR